MLEKSIRMLSGVGEKRALLYKSMGIDTVSSLLEFYPRDYLDYTQSVLVADCQPNQTCVIRATIIRKMPEYRIKKGLSIFKAIALDENNDMFTITIFNSVYKFNELILNNQYYFYGKMSAQKEMASPQFLLVTENMALMQPIYSLTAGITPKMIQLLQRPA
ncbi:MAG: ATP-dependent DNA helicase RecG, partial [Oscillospiraceae bacterium]